MFKNKIFSYEKLKAEGTKPKANELTINNIEKRHAKPLTNYIFRLN
jgi:hypothetical protein